MAAQPSPQHLDIKQNGDVTVVTFTGNELVDEEVIEFIGRELTKLVEDNGRRQLVLDFAAVKRMATHMLGELIKLHKRVQTAGGQLALCRLHAHLREVFEVTRLTLIFSIHASEADAVQSFGAPS